MHLDSATDQKIKLGLPALLAELSDDYGLGWSQIAKLVRVSVPAIRKWRTGGDITTPRLRALAQLAAFLKLLGDQDIADPAAWLMNPLSTDLDRGLTKARLYAEGHDVELLDYADGFLNLEQLMQLAEISPAEVHIENDLVMGQDGFYSIVPIGG